MPAAELAVATGIPEHVLVEKFGLTGKHIAAEDEHVSDLSVAAGERLLAEHGVDPESIDVVMYFGSMWKDYAVWQAAPWIAHRLGCVNAYAVEYDNVSCGTPVALRVARDMLVAEPELQNVLLVAACRESYLLDYANERSRFMFNFGDGAVAGLARQGRRPERAAALVRRHRRVAVAAGEAPVGRQRLAERRLPLPRRRRSGCDEGATRRNEPGQLRPRRRAGRSSAPASRSPTCRSSARCT